MTKNIIVFNLGSVHCSKVISYYSSKIFAHLHEIRNCFSISEMAASDTDMICSFLTQVFQAYITVPSEE